MYFERVKTRNRSITQLARRREALTLKLIEPTADVFKNVFFKAAMSVPRCKNGAVPRLEIGWAVNGQTTEGHLPG